MKSITFNLPPLKERQAVSALASAYCQDRDCAVSTLPHGLHNAVPLVRGVRPIDAPALAAAPLRASPLSSSTFTFTLSRVGAVGAAGAGAVLGGVAMLSPAPVSAAALRLQRQLLPDSATAPEEPCEYRDQYSVGDEQNPKTGCSRFCELFHGVAFSNDVSRRVGTISSLLGPTGHYERMSFWTHFLGAFVFAAYAIVRQILVRDDARLADGLTSAAAWTISAVFLTSSLYHCTAPDLNFAMVTRVLDYAAIYIGITVTTTADIAVATRGFVNVPAQTIVDLPASALILIVFFVWRRSRLPGESTWTKHEITSRSKDGCLLGRGLFSYGHRDLAHIQMRQSTSLLLIRRLLHGGARGHGGAGPRRGARGACAAGVGLRDRRAGHGHRPRLRVPRRQPGRGLDDVPRVPQHLRRRAELARALAPGGHGLGRTDRGE